MHTTSRQGVLPSPGLNGDTQATFSTVWIRGQINKRAASILKTYCYSRSLFTHEHPVMRAYLPHGLRAYFH
jgi:hypothetical protein